jgi:hypothetical protein
VTVTPALDVVFLEQLHVGPNHVQEQISSISLSQEPAITLVCALVFQYSLEGIYPLFPSATQLIHEE